MDMREARRHARWRLAEHAQGLADDTGEASPDAERLRRAFTDLAQWLHPQPLSTAVDPHQIPLFEQE
jgi:hypothetical protein